MKYIYQIFTCLNDCDRGFSTEQVIKEVQVILVLTHHYLDDALLQGHPRVDLFGSHFLTLA